MCLYPKLIKNRKYIANKKNGGIIPAVNDIRILMVPVGCGKCLECMKQKKRNWQVRLQEEIKDNREMTFVTLTFSNESIEELSKGMKIDGYERDKEIATLGVRRFLERWRKKNKKSIKHWLITELGHNGTENIHLHGLIFSKDKEQIEKHWKYGYVWLGEYVNAKTINYIIKYVTKTDEMHPNFTPKILCSKGIGSRYFEKGENEKNKYKKETNELYKNEQGYEMALPIYYRNKTYSEEEKEKLWIKKLDENTRYVLGNKINGNNEDEYYKALEYAREKNKRLGYGSDEKDWNKIRYERERRNLLHEQRTKIITENKIVRKENIITPAEEEIEKIIMGKIEDAF